MTPEVPAEPVAEVVEAPVVEVGPATVVEEVTDGPICEPVTVETSSATPASTLWFIGLMGLLLGAILGAVGSKVASRLFGRNNAEGTDDIDGDAPDTTEDSSDTPEASSDAPESDSDTTPAAPAAAK